MEKLFNFHNFGHEGNISFDSIGINGKMSEINAALGLSILKYFDEILRNRTRQVEFYNKEIDNYKISTIKLREETKWNFSYYPVIFSSESELLNAENKMNKNLIFPRRYFYPSLHTLPYVKKVNMEVSQDISKRILCLPIYHDLSKEDLSSIINLINN